MLELRWDVCVMQLTGSCVCAAAGAVPVPKVQEWHLKTKSAVALYCLRIPAAPGSKVAVLYVQRSTILYVTDERGACWGRLLLRC